MNLFIKDILELPAFNEIQKDALFIIKFIRNHHLVAAKFFDIRKTMRITKGLVLSVETRW
jgi:hypothetical protein